MNQTHDKKNERGAVLVLVAILSFVLIAFVALAIDINHLAVVKNELQNAADAGALAGALDLYPDPDGAGPLKPGELVNTNANQTAYDVAKKNLSDKVSVDVNWTTGNTGDVQRGHWSFGRGTLDRGFYPSNATAPTSLAFKTDAELDDDINYINAVKVTARRQDTPAAAFFAGVFGINDFIMSADAVAYVGFAGGLGKAEADAPIVICRESLLTGDGEYQCNIGRMINSGEKSKPGEPATDNTGAWASLTNVYDSDGGTCGSGTNSKQVGDELSCDGSTGQPIGSNEPIAGGDWVPTIGGELQSDFTYFQNSCFFKHYESLNSVSDPYHHLEPLQISLPVVDCQGANNVPNCTEVVGAVNVNIVYVSGSTGNLKAQIWADEKFPSDFSIPEYIPDDPDNNGSYYHWEFSETYCKDFMDLAKPFGEEGATPWDEVVDKLPTRDCVTDTDPFWECEDENWTDPGWVADHWNTNLIEKEDTAPANWHEKIVTYETSTDPTTGETTTTEIVSYNYYYTEKMAQWDCFVYRNNMRNSDGKFAPLAFKSIYMLPSCEQHEPKGPTTANNFGVLSKFPVLVE